MPNKNTKITLTQYIFLIYKTQIGIGVLTIPHDTFQKSNTDGWIGIIIGWAISVFVSIIIIHFMKKNPDKTLYELLPIYFGKWIGKLLIVCWILYVLFAGSYSFIYTIYIIIVWVLPNTDPKLLAGLFIIPIYQITRRGLPMISRFAELVFLITIWMVPVILISIQNGIWWNLLPILREGIAPVIRTIPVTTLSFLGFELAFFLYPHLQNKKHATRGLIIANSLTAAVLLVVTIISFIRLSEGELTYTVWPTLDLLKIIHFAFLERLEIIFISAYIIILFMSVIPYLHTSLLGVKTLFPKKINTHALLIIVLIGWVVLLYFPILNFETIIKVKMILGKCGIAFAFLFPVFIWMYDKIFSIFKKKKVEKP
jgi:spore germination protein (amino acid permease)